MDEAKSQQSLLTLISNVLQLFVVSTFGYLTDKGLPVHQQLIIISGLDAIFMIGIFFFKDGTSLGFAIMYVIC